MLGCIKVLHTIFKPSQHVCHVIRSALFLSEHLQLLHQLLHVNHTFNVFLDSFKHFILNLLLMICDCKRLPASMITILPATIQTKNQRVVTHYTHNSATHHTPAQLRIYIHRLQQATLSKFDPTALHNHTTKLAMGDLALHKVRHATYVNCMNFWIYA